MQEMMAQMMGGGMGAGMSMGGMPPGSMGGSGQRRRRREEPSVLPDSTRVLVRGLQGAAQHNGKIAQIVGFDKASNRYTVQLDGGDQLRIKPSNLFQQCEAEVINMQSRPECNGERVGIKDFDEAKGRYHALLKGQMAALQPCNVILPKGVRARVVGLTGAPQWNDKVGKVLDFDRDKGRYLVQMTDEQQLRVKLENLLL